MRDIDNEVEDWKDLVPEQIDRIEVDPPFERMDPERLCGSVRGLSPKLIKAWCAVLHGVHGREANG